MITDIEEEKIKERNFKTTSIVAVIIGASFIISHLILILMSKGYFAEWKEAGSQLKLVSLMYYLTGNTFRLMLFIAAILIIDVLIFILMHSLAKKYSTGLLFAPIPIYIAILTVILFLLFAPLFEAFTTN